MQLGKFRATLIVAATMLLLLLMLMDVDIEWLRNISRSSSVERRLWGRQPCSSSPRPNSEPAPMSSISTLSIACPAAPAPTRIPSISPATKPAPQKKLLARAPLFLHTPRIEAFGIVLLEAMAQQALPVCASLATYHFQCPAQQFYLHYEATYEAQDWARTIGQCADSPQLEALYKDNHIAVEEFTWSRLF